MRRNAGKVFLWVAVVACALVGGVGAVEPNYVRTTVYDQTTTGTIAEIHPPLISTEYSDGLGRQIQTQVQINKKDTVSTRSLVVGSIYDDVGRPIKAVKPFGADIVAQYYDQPLIDAANTYYPDAGSHAYSETKYSDDPLSRVIATGAPGLVYSLDNTVKHHPQFWYFGVPGSAIAGLFDAEGFIVNAILNAATFPDNVTIPASSTPAYYLTVVKDANGKFSQEMKDVFGRTIKTWSQLTSTSSVIAKYSYDILGNKLSEIPPAGTIDSTTYKYNTLGQVIEKNSPDAGIVTYEYDDAGRLRYYKDAVCGTDSCIVNDYDDLGRVVAIRKALVSAYGDVSKSRYLVCRYYDNADNLVQKEQALLLIAMQTADLSDFNLNILKNPIGRLVAEVAFDEYYYAGNNKGNKIIDLFSYTDEGQIERHWKIAPGLPLQIFIYEYSLQGKLLQQTYKNGSTEMERRCLTYDLQGRLATVSMKLPGATSTLKTLVSYDYSENGQMKKKMFNDRGVTPSVSLDMNYTFNIRDWLKTVSYNYSGRQFNEAINYDEGGQYNGNIANATYTSSKISPTALAGPTKFTYDYDDLNRLKTVTPNVGYADKTIAQLSENFTYDDAGRFQTKKTGTVNRGYYYWNSVKKTSRLRNANSNSTANNYFYDANGNMVIDVTKKMIMKYDWRNLPYEFVFLTKIPTLTTSDYTTEGMISFKNIDDVLTERDTECRVLTRVNMLYDASGNRVYKSVN